MNSALKEANVLLQITGWQFSSAQIHQIRGSDIQVINCIYHAPLTISPALGSPSEEMLTFPIFHQFQTAAIKEKNTKSPKPTTKNSTSSQR